MTELCRKTAEEVLLKVKEMPNQCCSCVGFSCYAMIVVGESGIKYLNLACWDKTEGKVNHKLCKPVKEV